MEIRYPESYIIHQIKNDGHVQLHDTDCETLYHYCKIILDVGKPVSLSIKQSGAGGGGVICDDEKWVDYLARLLKNDLLLEVNAPDKMLEIGTKDVTRRIVDAVIEAKSLKVFNGMRVKQLRTESKVKIKLNGKSIMLQLLVELMNRNSTLKDLTIEGVGQYPIDGVEDIVKAKMNRNKLTNLSLGYCQIDDTGAKVISEYIQNNNVLTTLCLDANEIRSNIKEIASALAKNTTLTTLQIVDNEINDEGAKAIGVALADNKTLTTLELLGNEIRDEGAMAIVRGGLKNKTLKSLGLSGNFISNVTQLEEMLQGKIDVDLEMQEEEEEEGDG